MFGENSTQDGRLAYALLRGGAHRTLVLGTETPCVYLSPREGSRPVAGQAHHCSLARGSH